MKALQGSKIQLSARTKINAKYQRGSPESRHLRVPIIINRPWCFLDVDCTYICMGRKFRFSSYFFPCQLWYIFLTHSKSAMCSLMGKLYCLLYCNFNIECNFMYRRWYTFQWIQIKLSILRQELSIFTFCSLKNFIWGWREKSHLGIPSPTLPILFSNIF